jgi:hypothetical protein
MKRMLPLHQVVLVLREELLVRAVRLPLAKEELQVVQREELQVALPQQHQRRERRNKENIYLIEIIEHLYFFILF